MKKVITICLLVVTLLLGGISSEAKTTRSNTSHKTSRSASKSGAFSITSLLHKKTYYDGTTGFVFNSDSNIEAALKKAGFSLKSKNVTKGEVEWGTEGDTEPGKIINYVYSKKGVTIEWTSYAYDDLPNFPGKNAIIIKFSDNDAKNAFIKSMKSNGYRKEYGTYTDAGDTIHIEVKGNTVILYGIWA